VDTKLKIFPNPVTTYCSVSYPVATDRASLSLYHADGRKIGEYTIAVGSTQRSIDVSVLSTGHYFIVYKNNDQTISSSFIKQK
jgi:hypothetical protein